MVRSSRDHVRALREDLVERAQHRCEWPECPEWGAEMAHLIARGMGGSAAADRLDNVAFLCKYHHDLLDGRTVAGRQREVARLLKRALDL